MQENIEFTPDKNGNNQGQRLTDAEVRERVMDCFDKRFNQSPPIKQEEWVTYCCKVYGDKSKVQYQNYYAKAKEEYEQNWRDKLDSMLDPAVNELYRLLADEQPKIRQRAIDQILKYTGNDIQKVEAKVVGEINVSFGE